MNSLKNSELRETCGITYILERKRITRMHLYIKPPDGEVLVTAPVLTPGFEIDRFVESRASWIQKHIEKFRKRPAQARLAIKYETGDILYFWGRPYRLEVIPEEGRTRGKISISPYPVFSLSDEDLRAIAQGAFIIQKSYGPEGTVTLTVPEGSSFEQREKIVRRKYKELLDDEAGRILDFWSEETGLRYSSWHTRFMKTRWGSLTIRDRKVCLNIRLAEKAEICLVYVALHEVAHVKVPDHGPVFKAVLTDHMPAWREAEMVLR